MSRSILPPCMRREGAGRRLQAQPRRSWPSLPATPPIDRSEARGVSLIELARMTKETSP